MADLQNPKQIRDGYDSISDTYDQRYAINPLSGVAGALRNLISELHANRVLEVGCGTGFWLKTLHPKVERVIGLDLSMGMLRRAFPLEGPIDLICGSATSLPFAGASFDLIFVVNAIHHFTNRQEFTDCSRRALKPGGALAIVGLDIRSALGHSVIYDYFPGALEFDQSRFPLWEEIEDCLRKSGLSVQPPFTVEHIKYEKRGAAILDDHFIQRYGGSTFMGLTDAQYEAGIARIKLELAKAEARHEEAVFRSEFQLKMITGHLQA